MLVIYNTLTKQKQEFIPLCANEIGIYVCGVTVYDYCHIGHAKTYLVFDVVIRYLRYLGYQVKYVRNITDIDDKIINKANMSNVAYSEVTNKYIQAMHEDYARLGLLQPDYEPKATEFIPEMIRFIADLIKQDIAYLSENNDVYCGIKKFKNYGKLAKRKIDSMRSGARVEVNLGKRDPLDFVLWKSSKENEPAWDSPWGKGRPGWHLECSVMAMHYLGETFDIHGGGFDLIFPHHENECALAEAISQQQFVKNWMHVGFLQINQEKMSKSLGNFSNIRVVLATTHPEVLRYFMISAHYRSQLEYSVDHINNSSSALQRLYVSIRGLNILEVAAIEDAGEAASYIIWEEKFTAAMNDDFNTPVALAVLFDLAREINKAKETSLALATNLAARLKKLANILGLLAEDPDKFLQNINGSVDVGVIENLIIERNTARNNKDWLKADAAREKLTMMGIVLEDTTAGTTWRRM